MNEIIDIFFKIGSLLMILIFLLGLFFMVRDYWEKSKWGSSRDLKKIRRYGEQTQSTSQSLKRVIPHQKPAPAKESYSSVQQAKPIETVVPKTNLEVKEPTSEYKQSPKVKQQPIQPEPEKSVTLPLPKTSPAKPLPSAKIETYKAFEDVVFTNYQFSIPENKETYPIFRFPIKGTVVRSFRIGNTKRRGYKEAQFQKSIELFFGSDFNVLGNARLNTGKASRPFEPDIAIIDNKFKTNLRIDIEIDEPYAAITRQPTHCKGDDDNRDIYFTDRGWVVIRFSEYQVHKHENECLKYIADRIRSVIPSFSTSATLANQPAVQPEKRWDIVQAQKWEKDNYREKYLDHEFKEIEEIAETIERDFNEKEQQEEKLVVPTSIGTLDSKPSVKFNLINAHPRDQRIRFYPEPHIYTIDNTPAPSASTVISNFFPAFDAYGAAINLGRNNPLYGLPVDEIVKTWNTKGKKAADEGTFLHEQIEKYYLDENYEQPEEFIHFENFVQDHLHLKPYRSEWRVFDEKYHIAGTIDMISKNGHGFEIYDWKRSQKIIDPYAEEPITIDNWGKVGVGKLDHIFDTSYNRYCLQQSLYKYILEKNYGIKVSEMYLVVLHPDYDQYYKISVPYMHEETEYILRTL